LDFGRIAPGKNRLETLLGGQASNRVTDEAVGAIQLESRWHAMISFTSDEWLRMILNR
jgi:hypothetical protein